MGIKAMPTVKGDGDQPLFGQLIEPGAEFAKTIRDLAGKGFWEQKLNQGTLTRDGAVETTGGMFGLLGIAQQNQAALARSNDARQSNLDLTREGVTHKLIDKAESAEERKHYADHYYTNDRAAIEQAGKDRAVDAQAQTSLGWAGVAGGFLGVLVAFAAVLKNKD